MGMSDMTLFQGRAIHTHHKSGGGKSLLPYVLSVRKASGEPILTFGYITEHVGPTQGHVNTAKLRSPRHLAEAWLTSFSLQWPSV